MGGATHGGLRRHRLQIGDTAETARFFGRKVSCHGPDDA
ncbi:hypothetical protein M2271_003479 [Streptomyces sp. LBL]|nr:hypothetical protein [Streptomyces sp. LBL]